MSFQSPLLLAVDRQQSNIVSDLLRMGADPSVSTDDGNTSYHLAVLKRDERSLRQLLKRSLNMQFVDMLNDKGFSQLAYLPKICKPEFLQGLLRSIWLF